jgi:predicted Zn-dependent protease
MKHIKHTVFGLMIASVALFISCDKNGDFLLFSIQNDIDLGAQMDAEIEANTQEFPILSRTTYSAAYSYLDDMVEHILDNADISYREEFVWEVHIINDDVLNAFVTPGGYIYVYSGLIKYLDNADDLAGVIGHEIAHADQRHSSKQLQRQYGISMLLSIILGDEPSVLEEAVGQIAGTGAILAFSRGAESEADAFSVEYLANTRYACNGAASFFQKLIDEGAGGGIPEFLSTHPNPDNRVADINAKATQEGCSTDQYADNTLPNCVADTDYICFKCEFLPGGCL